MDGIRGGREAVNSGGDHMIGQTISHYKITAKLGEGGMGEVYLATDTNLDRQVAIKVLSADRSGDSDARHRFIHEAKVQAMLSHPNIATFLDVGEAEGRAFLVMEYVEGPTLPSLTRDEKLSLPEILDLVIQVGEGLQSAHERGVVHRDIKPENILVTAKRQVKITDFGLAKWKGATTLTKDGTRMGTAYYMSPEQAEGRRVDHRSDLFSLGVILYELICQQRPFDGENESVILSEIVSAQPPPLARFCRDAPDELQRVVGKCLAKDPAERYQSAADLVADLRHLRQVLTGERPSLVLTSVHRHRYRKYVFASSAVFVVALVIFVLKPFKLEFVPEQKAAANENSLAVMYFNNLVDAEDRDKTAQMITSLLITGLSESQYLQVVSRQRLHDILRQLGKEGVASIDQNTASVVAAKAGVKWMITGDILQTQPRIVLTAEVSDVQSGRIVTTQRITGGPGEDLFAVTDKLSAVIRDHLSLPAPAKTEASRPVAEVTTHSPAAYRFYLEGLDLEEKMYDDEAMVRLQKAIALDSTFAMAYLHLATSGIRSGIVAPAITSQRIAKGAAYADRATWKEQCYLKAMTEAVRGNRAAAVTEFERVLKRYPQEKEAWKLLGNVYHRVFWLPEDAVSAFRQVVAIDSLDKTAYNSLAYCYDALGEFDKSLESINRYIALAPDEPNPYDTRGDLYAFNGRIDDAIASYKKALELKPDFYSNFKLVLLYIYERDYVHADSVSLAMAASSSQWLRSFGRYGLALSLIYRGRFRDGLDMLNQGLAADRLEQYEGEAYTIKLVGKVDCYQGMGQTDSALAELNRFQTLNRRLNPSEIDNGRSWQVELLAEKGELVQASAVAAALQTDIEKADTNQRYIYQYAQGCIAFARGDYQTAVRELERAAAAARRLESSREARRLFWMRYLLGRAYLTSGMLDRAVAEFEKVTRFGWMQVMDPFKRVKCHYYLGQAYEQSGWKAKAIEQYQTFLDIWKDADRELPEIVDARVRLAKLRSS